MPASVPYPKVSLELARGSIARWLVADGATVTAGEVLFEIDNDKAAVEVESPAAGTLRQLAEEGEEVEVGAIVAAILAEGETDLPAGILAGPRSGLASQAAAETPAGPGSPPASGLPAAAGLPSGLAQPASAGLLADLVPSAADGLPASPASPAAGAEAAASVAAAPAVAVAAPALPPGLVAAASAVRPGAAAEAPAMHLATASGSRRPPNPTPLARRIARERGIALEGLAGSGPGGRIQRRDVVARLQAVAAAPAARAAVSGTAPLHAVWLRRGEGVPLVLLHGYSADLNNWRGLLAGARMPMPLLALDLPAHGASPRAVPADLDALAAQLAEAVAQHAPGQVVLAGHSFGAAVAARIAARGLLDLRGLALLSPAGLEPAINAAFVAGILRASQPASLRPWLELLVHDPQVISEAFVAAVAAQRADPALTEAMAAFAARFFAEGTQAFSIRADLAGLELPVRVIGGRQDRVLPPVSPALLPGQAGLHLLDACGHMPHLEHPALVRRLLAELWRSAG